MARYFWLAALALLSGLCVPAYAVAQDAHGTEFDLDALFATVGAMYDVDPALLAAIAAVESHYRSDAVSPAGAMGMMQLMPATARRFDVADAFDPVDSALGAARFLAYLRREQLLTATPDLPSLIAAYNAGEGAVERYRGVPPYAETRRYVRRVLWRYLLGDEPATSEANLPAVASPKPKNDDTALLEQLARLRRARSSARRFATGDSGSPEWTP